MDEEAKGSRKGFFERQAFRIAAIREKFTYSMRLGMALAGLGAGMFSYLFFIDYLFANFIDASGEIGVWLYTALYILVLIMVFVIFAYVVPRAIAEKYYKTASIGAAVPLRLFHIVLFPAAYISGKISEAVINIFRTGTVEEDDRKAVDDLLVALEASEKSGLIDEEDSRIIENVIEFAGTPVKHIMVSRNKIMAIERGEPFESIIETIMDEGFSRVPVFDKTIDNIIGVIYTKDLLSIVLNKDLIIIEDALRTPFYVHEDEKIDNVLKIMQKNKIHMVIVTDGFGGTSGLVTLEDIIEEIVGDIRDEYDEEEQPLIESSDENEFTVKAEMRISDLNEILPEPLPESGDYESLGGLIMYETGKIPHEGEILSLFGYEIEILEAEKNYLESVRLRLIQDIDNEVN